MTRRGSLRIAGWGLFVLSLGACDFLGPDEPTGSGDLEGRLISPNGPEGSAVLELTGGAGLGTVSPIGGEVLYYHAAESSRIVVVLDDPGEIRFSVRTDDVGQVPEVRVIQVADEENALRPSLSGYSVRFIPTKDSSKDWGG